MTETAVHERDGTGSFINTMKKNLLFILICAGVFAVSVSNLWRSNLYPFPDLPNHLAEAYLFRLLSNPADSLHQYYRILVTPLTTATIHLYFCSLFADVEVGNKIFYSLYMLLLPASLMLLVHFAKGSRWIALLSMLFLYNFSMTEGFSAFTLGIALVLLDMLLLVRFMAKPSIPRAFALALMALILFYAHAVILVFAGAVTLIAILSRRGLSTRARYLGIAALVPAGILASAWLLQFRAAGNEQAFLPFLASYYRLEYFPSLGNRLVGLLYDNKQIDPKPLGHILALLFVAPLLVGFFAFGIRNKFKNLLALDNSSKHTAFIFFAVAGLCYLLLPDHLPGWWFLYPRFSVFVFLGMVWITSWLVPPRFIKPAGVLAVLVVLVHAALWFQYFSAFNALAKPFRALLYHSPTAANRTLAALIDDYDFRGSPVFIHFQNYQLIWNHGAVPTAITDYRFKLVQRMPGLPPYQEWMHNDSYTGLLDQYAGEDLLIVHGAGPLEFIRQDDRYVLLDQRDGWALFDRGPK